MAIRIRAVDGKLIALCAAKSESQEGDLYLDDAEHHALTEKFEQDFREMGFLSVPPSAGEVESLAAKFHEIYHEEVKRQGNIRHAEAYADLPENIKELDRVLARYVLTHPASSPVSLPKEVEEAFQTIVDFIYGFSEGANNPKTDKALCIIKAALSVPPTSKERGEMLEMLHSVCLSHGDLIQVIAFASQEQRKEARRELNEWENEVRTLILAQPKMKERGKMVFSLNEWQKLIHMHFLKMSDTQHSKGGHCSMCDRISALILVPPIRVTREWVCDLMSLVLEKLGVKYAVPESWECVDALSEKFREKNIIIEGLIRREIEDVG